MEISHRSKQFIAIQEAAKQRIIRLLGIPDSYDVLFLQGGSRLQFSMIPMNLLKGQAGPAQYVLTGSWGKYALAEAKKEGATEVIFDASATNYDRLPEAGALAVRSDAAYVHVTSNETIQGVQFPQDLDLPAPVVCDSSSDIFYRPLDITKYGLLYACAQKNAGPAGVTVVVIRRDLLERSSDQLPGYLNFKNHSKEDSMWNTPPTFAVYVLGLVTEWLESTVGGLEAMYEINKKKAALVYDVVDQFPSFYTGHARKADRSLMNVTFKLPSDEIEAAFLKQAQSHNLDSLKGHRSVGGIRASLYNAMPMEGAQALASFMSDFAQKNS